MATYVSREKQIHIGSVQTGRWNQTFIFILGGQTSYSILEKAKNLFFPDGNSAKGNLQDVHCTLLDFKQLPVDNGLSIGDIFNITGVTKLRFYLATKNACSDSDGSVHLESNDSDVSSLQHVAFEEKEENHETSDLMVKHFFILITYTY